MRKRLVSFVSGVDRVNRVVANVFCVLILPMSIALTWETVSRYVFDNPTIWAYELATMAYAVHMIMAGGYTALHDGHVRMDLLATRWSSRTKAIVNSCTFVLPLFFIVLLLIPSAEQSWVAIVTGQHSNTVWGPPTWPWKVAVPIGICLILLQLVATFIRDIHLAITGEQLQ